jgi:hypothetical protein
MTTKTLGTLLLVLAPAALTYFAGCPEAAHYVALGAVLALQLGVLARAAAPFAFLLPALYVAAAITAQSTDGVVALIAALAAAVGASSSQGLRRGMVALLAAALLGSFEPGAPAEVMSRAGFLLAGSAYGFLLAITLLRGASPEEQKLHPQSALGYAVLLAGVTVIAWFAARLAGFAHSWWLPLVLVAVSEPVATGSPRQALLRALLSAAAATALVFVADAFDAPFARVVLLAMTLLLALSAGRRHTLPAVTIVPVLVLLANHAVPHVPPLDSLRVAVPAFLPVLLVSVLGHWLFWTFRSGRDRVAA